MRNFTLVPILLFVLGLGACSHPSTVKEVLTAKGSSYWDMYHPRLSRIRYIYHFYANGKCFRYVNNRNGTMSLYDGDDIVLPNKWRVATDTLTIDGYRYPVARVSPDTLFLKATFSVGLEQRLVRDTLLLIRTQPRPIEVHE